MQGFEKLGSFYLGRRYDLPAGKILPDFLLYDAKDLTTHAVCLGMTGSGKTGLCLSLIEEAAIDGVPVVAIDPKGDLGNLLLTFPELRAADFRPWIDKQEAARQRMTEDEFAAQTAGLWRRGLAEWGQDGSRIATLRSSADFAIYTPGSSAGLPLSLLRSLAAPPQEIAIDEDARRERVTSTVSGLLALLGVEADPLQSAEHILLAHLLDQAWREGQDVQLLDLIRGIQTPPFDKIGFLDLETVMPAKTRMELSIRLNNLLASPTFASWMVGEPLDIQWLLFTPNGQPRVSIVSIAHLSDPQRMFLVTMLLNEMLAWVRVQSGTTSLRAILYMDEVFGFFPPTANPPSKMPMLSLLKQARAFGLGVVLASQNPVDLDYKGLANMGTWFLGRLQTQRDKARVMEGLEGAAATTGSNFDRQAMEATLAGLGNRVFLMHNVHEDQPVIFQSRWALSYLRGPLTRDQIQTLMTDRKEAQQDAARGQPDGSSNQPAATLAAEQGNRPVVPSAAQERFLAVCGELAVGERLVYRPTLCGKGRLHYLETKSGVDAWRDITLLTPVWTDARPDAWEGSVAAEDGALRLSKEPDSDGTYAHLPAAMIQPGSYTTWKKALANHLYRQHPLVLWKCDELGAVSRPGESEAEFRIRLNQLAREQRDLKIEKLRGQYTARLAQLQDQFRRAHERVAREKSQYDQQKWQTAVSLGTSVLAAMFGRKLRSQGNVARAGSTARGFGRAARERDDMGRAEENVGIVGQKLADLEAEFQREAERVKEALRPDTLPRDEHHVRPRKSDIAVESVTLVWTPWRVGPSGIAESMCENYGQENG